MQISSCRFSSVIFTACTLLIFVSIDAMGQRRRQPRRTANPPVVQPRPEPTPVSSEPRIVSTADETERQNTSLGARRARTTANESEEQKLQRTVNRLADQVDRLTEKIVQLESQQRSLVTLERLTRAEQRAESLRAQLRDVQAKELELEARAEQIEFDIQPSNIERAVATFGTTRPEEAREQRRRQLESERTRIRSQLDLMTQSRLRLESAIASAESEADLLRSRLNDDLEQKEPEPTEQDSDTEPAREPNPGQ